MRPPQRPWLGTVEIRTYLRTSRRADFSPIEDVARSRHATDLTGGVRLVANGRVMIDLDQWTETDWLWASFAQMVQTFHRGGSYAATWFPDAPVRFMIGAQRSSMVCLAYEGHERRRAVADKDVFFGAFCRAGIDYADNAERLGRSVPDVREPLVEVLDGLYDAEPWPKVSPSCLGRHPDAIAAEAEARAALGVSRLGW
jgi:hypothetical protein